MSHVVRQIAVNTIAQMLGKMLAIILSVVVVKVLTGYLTVGEYGQYTTIYQFLGFFAVMADLGLYTIAVREMSRDEEELNNVFGHLLSIRHVLVVLALGLAISGAFLIPQYQHSYIPWGVGIAALSVWLGLFNGTLNSILQVKLKMPQVTLIGLVGKVINVLLIVIGVYWCFAKPAGSTTTPGAFSWLLTAGVLGNLVSVLWTSLVVRKYTSLRCRWQWPFVRRFIGQSLPYGLALVLSTIYIKIDVIMLSWMKDPHAVGLYGVATKIMEVLAVFPQLLLSSVLPVLSKWLAHNRAAAQQLLVNSFQFLLAIAVPIVIGGFILSYEIVSWLSGASFLSQRELGFWGSDQALKLIIWTILFSYTDSLFGYTLVAAGHQKKLLYVNLIAVLLNIGLNLIFIPHWSFLGSAAITVVTELFIFIMTLILVQRIIRWHCQWGWIGKIIVSGAGLAGVLLLLKRPLLSLLGMYGIFPLVIIAGLTYLALLLASGALNPQFLRTLLRKNAAPSFDQGYDG